MKRFATATWLCVFILNAANPAGDLKSRYYQAAFLILAAVLYAYNYATQERKP